MGCCPTIPNIIIVYELVDNSLFTLLHMKRNIDIPLRTRVNIALDCARVYHYMHNLGIVHRDIKSHNVLIDSNYHVKVCDFGLARFIVSSLFIHFSIDLLSYSVKNRLTWEQERCSLQVHHAIWHPSCFKSDNMMKR